jgi:hypothetical protein
MHRREAHEYEEAKQTEMTHATIKTNSDSEEEELTEY